MHADVIVVGLGSMGCAAAAALARRGAHVVGLDRFAPPHDRGAHAGGSRIIRMAYMEGADYVPLVRRAYELWRRLAVDSGVELLAATGGLMLGRADDHAFAGALAAARAHDLPHEVLDAVEIHRRFPAFTPAVDEVGLFEEVAGFLRPEAAISALLRQATAAGAELRPGVEVLDWSADGEGVRVRTAGGTVEGGALVLAPGAWAGGLTRLAVPLRVERRLHHFWRPTTPELFEPARFPAWIWGHGRAEFYGLPTVDGLTKAGLHFAADGVGEVLDDPSAAAPARPEEVVFLRDWLRPRLPALADGEWLGSRPCHYTLTPDEHFVLGAHPDHARVSVACGFSGHGFKFVPVVGEILADLALAGTTAHAIDLFDPGRFARPIRSTA